MVFKDLRKKICAALAASAMFAGLVGVSAADTFEVAADRTELTYGETARITVDFPGGSVYNGAEVLVTYPSDKLKSVSVTTGDIYKNSFLNDKREIEGKAYVMALYVNNLEDGGELASFELTPAADVSGTAEIKLHITATDEATSVGHEFEKSVTLNISGSGSEVPSVTEAPAATATAKPSTSGGSGGGSTGGTAAPSPAPTAAPEQTEAATAAPAAEATEKPAATEAPVSVTFKDITSHWAKASIEHLASLGYVNGFDENTFGPELNVTRAEFVKMLTAALGIDAADYNNTFKDVSVSDWFAPYVAAAYNEGIAQGDDDGSFNPSANITRQEMAVMCARAYGLTGDGEMSFADTSSIADWAKDAVSALAAESIITGYDEDNTFRPTDNTTRAQAAVVIERLIER